MVETTATTMARVVLSAAPGGGESRWLPLRWFVACHAVRLDLWRAEARTYLAGHPYELPDQQVQDAALVLTELVGNAVRHAGGGMVAASVDVLVGIRVRIDVWDDGRSESGPVPRLVDPFAAADPHRWQTTTGFGLRIVAGLARWGTDWPIGTRRRVWAIIHPPRPEQAEQPETDA